MVQAAIADVTARIRARSQPSREKYLGRVEAMRRSGPHRGALGCANLAHGFAACAGHEKQALRTGAAANLAIVTAYNDMLSAHQPYERFPAIIKKAAHEAGGVAQVAGGVPAMCDGITQGRAGMELSLFSRDVIAMSAAIALSHDMFDAAVFLGVCDKIVPGLVIAAQAFGHLPAVFIPAGPMPSGLPNQEKAKLRQLYAEGKATRDDLLEAEAASYHSPGTCTFYGTANSNQMLMEAMGLHLPGSSFVNPNTPLRDALTAAAAQRALAITALGNDYTPVASILDERAFVNGIVALHATGGSTNHVIHLIAMARAGGIILTLDDFADLSKAVPLLTRIYPNGTADVNHFTAAGGTGFLIGSLLGAGLLHPGAKTVAGCTLEFYAQEPYLDGGKLAFRAAPSASLDESVLRPAANPFSRDGGLKVLDGNLGRAVIKISAVAPEHRKVRARARIFHAQEEVEAAFRAGELNSRFGRGGSLPGRESDRHAGVAQADARARVGDGARPSGGAGHRWPHVGRVGKSTSGDPCDAGSARRRPDRPAARRRYHSARRGSGHIERWSSRRRPCKAVRSPRAISKHMRMAMGANCSRCSAPM